MKKSISILAMCALAGASALFADPVSPQRASDIAVKYVSALPKAPAGLKAKSVETLYGNLYLVHLAPAGYAIISSDDNAEPLIAYSLESNLSQSLMPENMAFIVKEAAIAVDVNAKSGSQNNRWTQIENGTVKRLSRANAEPVDPLISVTWDQPAPYNKYCPGTGNGKAIVGCVAVAMSQAMSVHQYPKKPMGNMTYASPNYGQLTIDFDKEAEYNWKAILSGANNYDETARLLYHAGMSVMMDYGTDGSGIPSNQVYRITNALKNTFGYHDANYYQRSTYRGDWEQLILNQLSAGNALVYNAIDTKGGYGHSFNVDGFDGTYYHINWGWGGVGNGYFSIDALRDAQMNMNYDSSHYAVTGISAIDSPLRDITLSDLIVESDTPAGAPVSALLVNGEMPTSDMKVSITGEYNKNDNSYKEIPFEYKNGIIYTSRQLSESEGAIYVRVVVTVRVNGNDLKLNQGFNVQVTGPQGMDRRTSVSYDRASQKFSVHSKFGANYVVKNAQGAVVTSGTISANPVFEFNRSQLTPGNNTIEVSANGKTKVVNIAI